MDQCIHLQRSWPPGAERAALNLGDVLPTGVLANEFIISSAVFTVHQSFGTRREVTLTVSQNPEV